MERPRYKVDSRVTEEQLRRGIRTGQRRWAAWVFAVVCLCAAVFALYKIFTLDSFDDMYTWIVCLLVGGFAAYPAFTAGRRQENQICSEVFESGDKELQQSIRFYEDRIVFSDGGGRNETITYPNIQKVPELDDLVTIVAGNRARVFMNRADMPDGVLDFLCGKMKQQSSA